MKIPLEPNARTRIRIAFLLLFVFMIAGAVGAYYIADRGRLQELVAAREGQAALQGIADVRQIDEALRLRPQNKFLRMMAVATKAADEANVAIEKLFDEIEPLAISKAGNLGTASRGDLEALRRDLKVAETNATTFMPRYVAVLKAERDNVEKYVAPLYLERDAGKRLLDNIDKRHAEITALISRMLSARADYYRAHQNYLAFLVGEFGSYKIVNGQFIFPLQRTVDRYNVAAQALNAAAKPVGDLNEERKRLLQSQQERWQQFVRGE